jgi:peptide/nickel transport system permease protein
MRPRDALQGFRAFWGEFSKVKSGLVGLALLLVFVLLGFFGPAIVPFPGASEHWRDIAFWQDNPQAAPPAWTNFFASKKGAASAVLEKYRAEDGTEGDGSRRRSLSFDYRYAADKPPRDIIARFRGSGRVALALTLTRPDGLVADLYEAQAVLPKGELQRVSITRNCAQATVAFVAQNDEYLASTMDADLVSPMKILFSKLGGDEGGAEAPLKGAYLLKIEGRLLDPAASLDAASVVVSGEVSGLLGTDTSKRDLFSGVVIGVRWALVIGLLTSLITVVVGVLFGVVAAYFGGAVDWLLTRLYELVYLMPVLPFLIVIAAVFKPSIWVMIAMICLFFWVGPYKPVYSMALQIKEETYVEASRALGSSGSRIVLRHIIPILLPYSFAVMALSIPGVIVYESSVSLLGLGDATKVTWGQVLHDALGKGAVINNLWWWVIPPGLMIALMGMSFAFLGTALDKILHPKLKTR